MKEKLKKIENLTRKIFNKLINVSRYCVTNEGLKIIVRIYNTNNLVVIEMQGDYNNLAHVCKLILEEQNTKGGKTYEQQQQRG